MFVRAFCYALVLLVPCLTASALVERMVERSYPVSAHAALKVDTFFGGIQVKAGDAPEIKVVVHESIDAKTEEAADRALRDIDVAIDSVSTGLVTVRAQSKRAVRWTWEKWPPAVLAIEVTVPKNCDLDIQSREGAIVVGNVHGDVNVRAFLGTVFIGDIEGSVTAWSAEGDVSVTACSKKLNVTTRAGNIVVGRAFGQTDISGTGGAVEIQSAKGAIRAEVEGGDLKVGFAYPVRGDADLKSNGGDVLLSFDPRSAVTLEVKASSSGKATVRDLPLSSANGESGVHRIDAALNGGGPRIVARASSGNVRLLGVPAVSE